MLMYQQLVVYLNTVLYTPYVYLQVLKDEKLGDNAIAMGNRVRDGLKHMNAPIVEVCVLALFTRY
jgi:hypothetical protein